MQKTTDASKLNAVTDPSPVHVDKFQQAFQLHQQGQLERADALYTELLKEQPQHRCVSQSAGTSATRSGFN
ncbi:MAG: hypothetical protein CG439_2833 [Methylococcaceae bacterium NSP1-2]|nr:MAG: hypothetical protein CG439_2833 [Methylococcaceae bacterium NSP1-2]